MGDADHEKFVKLTRERGHLLTYPTVHSVADDERTHEHDLEYEVLAGNRRFDTAWKAGLDGSIESL